MEYTAVRTGRERAVGDEMEKKEFKSQYEKVTEITEKLETNVRALFDSDKYKTWLSTMSKFYNYSLNNTLLIAMQKPDATYVASYNAWRDKFGRNVKKGEHGIQIFAPCKYKAKVEQTVIDSITNAPKLDKDGQPMRETVEVEKRGFKVVTVFDISSTEGKELPTLGVDELTGAVEQYPAFMEALKKICPVPIAFEDIDSGAKGYYHQLEQRIAIKSGMSEMQTLKTLIHEMSHQRLHAIDPTARASEAPKKSRESKEVEAESVAYTVCQHFGIDTSDYSFAYLAGWSQGKELKELKESLQVIRDTANDFITEINGQMKSKEMEKDVKVDAPVEVAKAEQKAESIVADKRPSVLGVLKIKQSEPMSREASTRPLKITSEMAI